MFYFSAWSWDAFECEQVDRKFLKQTSCAAALRIVIYFGDKYLYVQKINENIYLAFQPKNTREFFTRYLKNEENEIL